MKILFSAYRLDQYSDPEGFKVNIGLVLEQYPIDTIRFTTDPRTGVQRRHEWPPSVKNVVDACDDHMHQKAKSHRFANWGKPQMIEGPKERKPTLEELRDKYGEDWGMSGSTHDGGLKRFDWDAAAKRLMEKHPDQK